MLTSPRDHFFVLPVYQPLMRQLGIDAEAVFSHPLIVPWRTLADRENCTLDAQLDGRRLRLHIKRYPAGAARLAEDERTALDRLRRFGVPSIELAGYGTLADGRSFIMTEDLAGHHDAEQLLRAGGLFQRLLEPTADVAARLHGAGLHHRDLYLCHFFVKAAGDPDVRLIDAARVRPLSSAFTRRRWIVKDLAQFWYSTLALPITDAQRNRWLERYAQQRGMASPTRLRRAIERKARAIGRHDEKLRRAQPQRNISIPPGRPS
jgi:heptose I phosphotransferase